MRIGDGPRWIANQAEEKLGSNGTYLIDFIQLQKFMHAELLRWFYQPMGLSVLSNQQTIFLQHNA